MGWRPRGLVWLLLFTCSTGVFSQRVVFEDEEDSGAPSGRIEQQQPPSCITEGGPQAGLPCQFPFIYNSKVNTGCITDNDPEGKFWCSTKVDENGVHVPNEDNFGHCGPTCPGVAEIEGAICSMTNGELGKCLLATSCVGVDISFIEGNPCELLNKDKGVCCEEVTSNNIVAIVDKAPEPVDIPIISVAEADVFLRFGVEEEQKQDQDGVNFGVGASVDETGVVLEEDLASEFHLRFNTPRKDILAVDEEAQILLEATKKLKEDKGLTDLQAGLGLRAGFNSDTSAAIDERCPWTPAPTCNPNLVYRSWDGSCNNLKNSNFGRTGTPYQRILPPAYAKGSLDLPRKSADGRFELPSARSISNALIKGGNTVDTANTVLVMQMGQFIDHDITHTPNHGLQCCGPRSSFPSSFDADKCFPIRMEDNDPFWSGRKTCMNFARSLSSPDLKCSLSSREQLNQITHWLDGSNIYGSTVAEAMYLRGPRGSLKISTSSGARAGSLPSCSGEQVGKVTGCDVCGSRKDDCFFAGDFRVNEQLNLIVIHTLFMREHNRLASALSELNPSWSDEKIYQEARKMTISEYQHIIFKEWLPIIIGNNFMRSYGLFPLNSGFSTDYADTFDPRINNEFAAAAFRFGHSMIPDFYTAKNRGTSDTLLSMRDIFFKPKDLKKPGFLDSLVEGMAEQGSQMFDASFVKDITDHLFEGSRDRGGLDLVAVNIQRGRDHGIPGYNDYREICLGRRATSFEDLKSTINPETVNILSRVYKSVDDIDLYIGGFSEGTHEDSILGPVFKCIVGDQFARLKKGDRFFYDLGVDSRTAFTLPQLDQIRKTSLARIICDNTDNIDSIQPLVFKMSNPSSNPVRSCNDGSIPKVNLAVFREGFQKR